MQKLTKNARVPQRGWGMGSKEPIRRQFLLSAVTISVNLFESSWFLYRMKPRLYKFPKILKLWSMGGFERSQSHFQTTASLLSVIPAKRQRACYNEICPKSL